MNKPLFWAGITLQCIHLLIWIVIGLSLISWDYSLVLAIAYITFNIATLVMIFIGALAKDKGRGY